MIIADDMGREHDVVLGTKIVFYPKDGRGGHGAHVIVDKLNKKSFRAVERKGSYKAGKTWMISIKSTFAICIPNVDEIGEKTYWFNDF